MELVYKLAKEVQKEDGILYLVGGCVRDKFLGLESQDIDIEIFGIEASTFESILSKYTKWKKVGKYEIYLLRNKKINYEISLAKDKFNNILDVFSLEKASKRRDLTINSIYYEPLKDSYLDYHQGIRHIKERKLNFISEKEFLKDPLRILRVITFISRFDDFTLEKSLEDLILENSFSLINIEKERIFIELSKILLLGNHFEKAFKISEELGISKILFSELLQYKINFKRLNYKDRDIKTSLVLLLSKANKVEAKDILKRISLNKKLNEEVCNMIEKYRVFISLLRNPNKFNIKLLALEVDINLLVKIYLLRNKKQIHLQKFLLIYNESKKTLKPIIKGKDLIILGFKTNVNFGEVLKELHILQLKDENLTKEDLINYAKSILSNRQI